MEKDVYNRNKQRFSRINVHDVVTTESIITYKSCARDKPYDRTATSRRERCQSLYDRM